MKEVNALLIGGALLVNIPANATLITYEKNHISGNTWEYAYSVNNDSLSLPIENFAIIFEEGLYENINAISSPLGWDILTLQPDSFLPDDGIYDALALSAPGIAPGNTLGGFVVQFDFLGTTLPETQNFQVIEPSLFSLIDSGSTQANNITVPAPPVALLLLISIPLLTFYSSSITNIKTKQS